MCVYVCVCTRTHLCGLVPKAGDVDDGDDLEGHHPLVLNAILLTQLGLLLQVLFREGRGCRWGAGGVRGIRRFTKKRGPGSRRLMNSGHRYFPRSLGFFFRRVGGGEGGESEGEGGGGKGEGGKEHAGGAKKNHPGSCTRPYGITVERTRLETITFIQVKHCRCTRRNQRHHYGTPTHHEGGVVIGAVTGHAGDDACALSREGGGTPRR